MTERVIVSDVRPFGINLGNWTFWGAEQLSSNVIKNPGFEGLIDGAIAIPSGPGRDTFDDSPDWLGRPDGFWEGARFSIRSGPDAGKEGRIVHSLRRGRAGHPSYSVREGDPVPGFGSAVALVRDSEDALPTQWWFSKGSGTSFAPAKGQVRPGSPGVRALRIRAAGAEYAEVASYLDTIGERAGKMLPLTGKWQLSFWVKLDQGEATLRVLLGRDGSKPVVERDVRLSVAWTKIEIPFESVDDGPPGSISLRFQVTGHPGGQVLLDDVDLRRARDEGKPFRAEVIEALRSFHPGYLRDWQGQLADTFENRVAPAFARKSYRYRPGPADTPESDAQTDFGYGIGDLLDLAAEIGSVPWIVLPATFTDGDCGNLGSYLSARKSRGSGEVMVEFGNESWNDLFRPAGIPDPVMYAQAADRCFAEIRRHATGVRLKTVMGVQFANPRSAIAYARESGAADLVAVAPYFAYSLTAGLPVSSRMALLFQPDRENGAAISPAVAAMKKETAVYEVNLHTTLGSATADERRPMVSGMASGSALAKTLLDGLARGIRRQCVYGLSGFDWAVPSGHGFIPLWGVVRDLGSTQRVRPTGLALQLLSKAVKGDMFEVQQSGAPDFSVYAFGSGGTISGANISIVAVSASGVRRRISVLLPPKLSARNWNVFSLTAPSPEATNEDSEQVRIVERRQQQSGRLSIELEPWSMAVVTVAEASN